MRRATPNTVQWGIEVNADLAQQVAEFIAERGQTKRQVIEEALRRHLAYPPPVAVVEPLPDVESPAPRPRGKAK